MGKKIKYEVKNVSESEKLKENYLTLTIEGTLRESGLSGRYNTTVCVLHTKKNIKYYKEFICSVTKKDIKPDEIIEYVYLNHLEIDELLDEIREYEKEITK